ncbi:MAG TPA: DUF2314 domain-containing protein [Chthoniobacterales bacterium]
MLNIIAKRAFGSVAFLVGLGLSSWFIYNQFWPTPEFKSGFRSVFQLFVPIACMVVGWRWLRYEGKGIEEITPPDLKCSELERSVAAARETMPYFLEQVDKNVDGAFVKFPLKTPQGLIEHIWSYVHSFRDDRFNVSLANAPFDDQQPADGRRDVPMTDVEDWQILHPDGRIKGAHSLIALFRYHENRGKKLSPKMKKQKAQLIDAT